MDDQISLLKTLRRSLRCKKLTLDELSKKTGIQRDVLAKELDRYVQEGFIVKTRSGYDHVYSFGTFGQTYIKDFYYTRLISYISLGISIIALIISFVR